MGSCRTRSAATIARGPIAGGSCCEQARSASRHFDGRCRGSDGGLNAAFTNRISVSSPFDQAMDDEPVVGQ
jgi:hypothetical protein